MLDFTASAVEKKLILDLVQFSILILPHYFTQKSKHRNACKSDRINRHHNKDSRINVFMINLYFSTICFGLRRTIIR
jgi:hypothetical protein